MDIYRRSRLSEQELEALELREREVNGGEAPLGRVSWGLRLSLLLVALSFRFRAREAVSHAQHPASGAG